MTPEPVTRNYLHDQVATRLRALIQTGELKPKERLNEAALTQRFGISRTPLREAIKILATEGLLDLLPNRGSKVASFSEGEIDDVLEVIAALEATAGELACRHLTPQDLAGIEALHHRMTAAHAEQDIAGYFDLNRQIHEAILQASRNGVLQNVYATLSSRIQRARFAAHKTPGQWQAAMDDHDRMIVLLRARDGQALGTLLRTHVRSKKAVIVATFGRE